MSKSYLFTIPASLIWYEALYNILLPAQIEDARLHSLYVHDFQKFSVVNTPSHGIRSLVAQVSKVFRSNQAK